jgi:hypothetical protein
MIQKNQRAPLLDEFFERSGPFLPDSAAILGRHTPGRVTIENFLESTRAD